MTTLTPSQIFYAAQAAAIAATVAAEAKLPPETQRGLDCGFAWVTVKPARGPFIKYCREQNKGSKNNDGGGGWYFWNPSTLPTQSIGPKEAGAQAFAEVLKANGLNAYADSRLD